MGKKIIMKILLVIAMFGAVKAAPEAEADAAVLYGGHYGYGLGHYGYGLGGYGGYYGHAGAIQAGAVYATAGPMDPTTELDPWSTLLAKGRLKPRLTPLFCTLVPMEVTMVVSMEV